MGDASFRTRHVRPHHQRHTSSSYTAKIIIFKHFFVILWLMLEKDLIQNPSEWRLSMRIDRDMLHVMAFSPRENDSLIYRALPLGTGAPSRLKAIEDTVYDNPMLLNDFARIDCLISTSRFILTPDDDSPADDSFALLRKVFPPDRHTDLAADGMGGFYMQVDEDVLRFLRRTFAGVRVSHPLVPLINYFTHIARQSSSAAARHMYASFHADHIDIVATDRGQLMMANSFYYSEPLDIVYYILACRQQLGFDPENDPLFLTGDATSREEAAATLHRYVRHIMPVIFPSVMLKYGKDAMNAPFDLTALSLCE